MSRTLVPSRTDDLTTTLRAWPPETPLAVVRIGGGEHGRAIVGAPSDACCWRPGDGPPAAWLDARLDATRGGGGGWFVLLDYELGRAFEPTARSRHRAADRAAITMLRCDEPREARTGPVSGTAPERGALGRFVLRPRLDRRARARHEAGVSRALELIAAGDVYQVNLSRRIAGTFRGDVRAFAAAAWRASAARRFAYLELPGGRAVVSMSPELFVELDAETRRVRAMPIKGTRPEDGAPLRLLLDSAKDEAELVMIVDLLRNDLGRVCRPGSVRVTRGRFVERHATVQHATAEIGGVLRDDATPGSLLAAAFPCGSITGAPRIRAMQVIDELEAVPRGAYCGSIGWMGDDGAVSLSVAIRTVELRGRRAPERYDRLDGRFVYGTGGGIVADSTPADEWRETEVKAEVLRRAGAVRRPHPEWNGGIVRP